MERIDCGLCGGDAVLTTTTVKIIVGTSILFIHDVPCYECNQCGETLYSVDVAERLEDIEEHFSQITENTDTTYTAA